MVTRKKLIYTPDSPAGLLYVPDFLDRQLLAALTKTVSQLDYDDFVLQGVAANRKVKQFGYKYEFYSQKVQPTEAFPVWLEDLKAKVAHLGHVNPKHIEQGLIARYAPGAGIG